MCNYSNKDREHQQQVDEQQMAAHQLKDGRRIIQGQGQHHPPRNNRHQSHPQLGRQTPAAADRLKRAITRIQKSWAGALKRAKITRRLRPYDLRHAFATMALESGADIGAVADIIGSSPETIRRHYQHVSREAKRQTVNLIPKLGFDVHD